MCVFGVLSFTGKERRFNFPCFLELGLLEFFSEPVLGALHSKARHQILKLNPTSFIERLPDLELNPKPHSPNCLEAVFNLSDLAQGFKALTENMAGLLRSFRNQSRTQTIPYKGIPTTLRTAEGFEGPVLSATIFLLFRGPCSGGGRYLSRGSQRYLWPHAHMHT